ncbi:MAG: adenylate/guanylate cyclase domain-containing protein [Spirochaetota bacterium]
MKQRLSHYFQRLSAIADLPDDSQESLQQHRFLIYMGLFMSFGGILWGSITIYANHYVESIAPYGYTLLTICNFLYLNFSKNFRVARVVQLLLSLLVPFAFQWSLGGFVVSGGMMLWSLLGILGAFTLQNRSSTIGWLFLYLGLTLLSGLVDAKVKLYGIDVPQSITTIFFTLNIGFISTFVFFLVYYFIYSAEKAHDSLEKSYEVLEDRVEDRTKELSTSLVELNSKNSQLEALSSKLSKYLSKQIYDSIFHGKQDVKIESRRKKLTIFFSDIKDFTSITDTLESEELTALLNTYLNEMATIALTYGGTIDKFIGDAIMIFFGDPKSKGYKQDALDCVNMAIDMQEKMQVLRKNWEEEGIDFPLHIRMGINTGFCTVGNFGSDSRLDYTIIGGQVNLASRLESQANVDQILLSHESYCLVRDSIDCDKKAMIQVKGIQKPVQTYEVSRRKVGENPIAIKAKKEDTINGNVEKEEFIKTKAENEKLNARMERLESIVTDLEKKLNTKYNTVE